MDAARALPAGWMAVASYFYVLGLDGPALAWEYLRRQPSYRQAWAGRQRGQHQPEHWGLTLWEDPALDARQAHPVWQYPLGDQVMLQPEQPQTGAESITFDLWTWQGRKQIRALGDGYALQVQHLSSILRARCQGQSFIGQSATITFPFDRRFKARLRALQRQRLSSHLSRAAVAPQLEGAGLGRAYAPGRTQLLHLRALLALDALQAGAVHRQIATALVGACQVHELWHADATLRSLIRYYIRRGQFFRDGGYWQLLSAQPENKREN
ncbi:DNA -binding domain-containing protein [Alcaligenes faecalis]|uniref:DNA -binding domain-containing protein n=1 Tax=Alcaligenes faecalis TaxID=511 RepID=UPI001EF0EFEE|nr:DUF2285 domain-containing protein [Alcaligenes faecalis]ULH06455.1 DUF2285 domain-containing protein [Alcaligenes faecalis]